MTFTGSGLKGKNYSWSRILTSENFLKSINDNKVKITDSAKENINNYQWIFVLMSLNV